MSAPAGFTWTREPWGLALVCAGLAAFARHLFTTRHLALKRSGEDAPDGWDRLAASVGVLPGRLARARQVHGTAVAVVEGDRFPWVPPRADVLLASDSSTAVAVQVADCVPILFADPRTGAVAAAHAGWRGTAAGVAIAAVEALVSRFGARAAELSVAIGPSIGPCCYEVGRELAAAFRAAGHGEEDVGRWFTPREGTSRLRLDLWSANEEQLRSAGVPTDRLFVARLCTACHPDLYCSYRRDGDAAGRMAGVIRPAGRPRPSRGSRAGRLPR